MIDTRVPMKAAAVAAAALLGAGCGAQIPNQTAEAPAAGVDGQVGSVLVRDMFVLGGENGAVIAAGGAAPLYLTLIDQPADVATAGPSGAVDTSAGGDALTGATSPAAASVEISDAPVALPAGGSVKVGPQARIVLRGLKQPLDAGQNVSVRLQFRTSGAQTFSVPVLPRQGAWQSYAPAPAAS
ncbi:copper chaperone PCu(A)C [Actinomadura parmotrematis]|uniref:Copper chaperone PCu(A)C n=1 Tax=Actinomadura parmotrematis TaxID=2864039 RepID=A0ABS7G233_9ACTN|nr:copper chaperone PCu(A)C [Actinomadura parmotrematis]MBW8486769.1 copper chaperone PCu(A)C [Actinomadura parmotrematis]